MPEVRQTWPSETDSDPRGPHCRLQEHCLLGDHCGEYAARRDRCKTFRNTPEGVLPKALYDNSERGDLTRMLEHLPE